MVQFKTSWKNWYLIGIWLCCEQVGEQGEKALLAEEKVSLCVIV